MSMQLSPMLILASVAMGFLSAFFAKRRGRNPYTWFFVGFFFGLLGIMAIFFAPAPKKKLAPQPPSKPLPTIEGPSNKFWYYLDSSHAQVGPISHSGLTSIWRQGKISLSTYVWHEELPEWKLLKEMVKE